MDVIGQLKQCCRNVVIKRQRRICISTGTVFEGDNIIERNTWISNSVVGYGTYFGDRSSFENCIIGRFCSISSYVQTVNGTHPTDIWVSTHPAFFSDRKQSGFSFVENSLFEEYQYVDGERKYLIEIGNDVWIGTGAMILQGVRIGDGAIIAAGAVVTKDVEPYSIVGGVPAKLIKYRFDEEQIRWLLDYKWWLKSRDWVKKHAQYFSNIDLLRKIVEKEEANIK